MPLTRPNFRVLIDDVEHVVDVMPRDQLRAETEGNRRGLTDPARQGLLLTMLWLWAACRRRDLVDPETSFDAFVDKRLTGWERVKPEHEGAQQVDPTHEAGSSTPASSSTPDSPDSTGSPSSTTTPPSSLPPYDSSPATPTTTDPSARLVTPS